MFRCSAAILNASSVLPCRSAYIEDIDNDLIEQQISHLVELVIVQ